jgi:ubiquinone/menaquinone biosynthesis C-methylase UbiE
VTVLPFSNASFDTVCCIAAINHIPERRDFLREARRVLRPEGTLVLTMIPPEISRVWHCLRSPWDADQCERGMKSGELYGLSKKEMYSLLQDTGFNIYEDHTFMFGINRVYIAK